jgi:hypothetical protein
MYEDDMYRLRISGSAMTVTIDTELPLGLIPLQLRKEEERRAVHFYGGEKVTYVAQTPAYGATTATATVIAEPEMERDET